MGHYAKDLGLVVSYVLMGIFVVYITVRVGASAWFRSKKEYYQQLIKHQPKEPHDE